MFTNRKSSEPKGWHRRGYLPHFDGGEICQFVTIHLGDALPQEVLVKWKTELEKEKDENARMILNDRYEAYLDQSYGACYLKDERLATQVQESLLYHGGTRYKLISWVVMPNHAHFLIKPLNNHSISEIMKKFKSFTSHEANKLLQKSGKFWQEDYFDRYIRNREHYEKTITYIENNPVKAKLCQSADQWKFGSAYYRKYVLKEEN